VTAARNLRDSGKTARESKASIDMAAAVGILEFAIELEKRK
jgi:RNase H-fold protein (predicted Holliday junction resolvase)